MRVLLLSLCGLSAVSAFTTSSSSSRPTVAFSRTSSSSRLNVMIPDGGGFMDHDTVHSVMTSSSAAVDHFMNSASHFLLSSIDDDVAKLSENEFKPVFLGGLAIAFGGALSTVAVGMMIDSKEGGYQEILTESYLEAIEKNPDFWARLNEDETARAKEAIDKLKDKRGWGIGGSESDKEAASQAIAASGKTLTPEDEKAKEEAEKEVKDIFSDY